MKFENSCILTYSAATKYHILLKKTAKRLKVKENYWMNRTFDIVLWQQITQYDQNLPKNQADFLPFSFWLRWRCEILWENSIRIMAKYSHVYTYWLKHDFKSKSKWSLKGQTRNITIWHVLVHIISLSSFPNVHRS